MSTPLVKKVQKYVESFCKESLPAELHYHNLNHTREMVGNIEEIGAAEKLSDDEMETALIAGWFHDAGFAFHYVGHEKASAELADTYLREQKVSDAKIVTVKEAIMATDLALQPHCEIDRVVRDADTLHVGKENYKERMNALMKEQSAVAGDAVSEKDALKDTIKFYYQHQFYTDYAEKKYGPTKQANLKKLKMLAADEDIKVPKNKKKKKKNKKARKDLERGIQTMFRNTVRTHIQLSAIADNKANIMLSVNAIILSIVVSNLIPKINMNPYLLFPTIILVVVCLGALTYAILAVRPSVTNGRFSADDIENKTANLLFFGNFHKMPMKDFEWGMNRMMVDNDFLYSSMIKDFYYLGLVLAKKYRYLRLCYNIFMVGVIVSAASFLFPLLSS